MDSLTLLHGAIPSNIAASPKRQTFTAGHANVSFTSAYLHVAVDDESGLVGA